MDTYADAVEASQQDIQLTQGVLLAQVAAQTATTSERPPLFGDDSPLASQANPLLGPSPAHNPFQSQESTLTGGYPSVDYDTQQPVPSTDTTAPPPPANDPWYRPLPPYNGPPFVPRLRRMEPCPHCGNDVHLATHKCYVTQRDLSCWTCGQKGHVRMTCKAGRPGSATVTMSPHAEPEDLNRTLLTLRRQLDGLSGRDEARFLALKEDLQEILAAQARQRVSRSSLQARPRAPPPRPSSAPPPTSRDPHPRAASRPRGDADTSPESSPVASRPRAAWRGHPDDLGHRPNPD
jgi:ribosomal protein S27AE